MYKIVILLLGFLFVQKSFSQISVYDCNAINSTVTQAEIESVPEFYQPCVEFNNGSYLFIGNSNHTVRASNNISLQPGFHAGSFTPNGQMHLMIEPKSEIDIVKIGPGDLSNVLRYKKLELGISLPADLQVKIDRFINNTSGEQINPFLEYQIDVEIEFTHVASGTVKSIDGFYFRDFERNDLTNDWVPKPTNYPFRVRFAPPLNGKWTAQLKIKKDGFVLNEANEFVFNVFESGDPGYVTVHNNNKNLQRGNRIIFPVGHNFPYPKEGVIEYPSTDPNISWTPEKINKTAPVSAWKSYLQDVENYANFGGEYIRVVQAPWASLIEFEEKGNYYNRLHYAWEQDKLFDLCEEKDVLVLFNMMIHEPIMLYGNYYKEAWDWDRYDINENMTNDPYPVYCYNDNPGVKKPHEMFLDTDENSVTSDLYYHEQRTRYYISRYGYSTKIYEFELLSEPFHMNEPWKAGINVDQEDPLVEPEHQDYNSVRTAYLNFNVRISNYIQIHAEQLVGISLSSPAWSASGTNIYDPAASLTSVDVLGKNYYAALPNKLLIQKDNLSDNNDVDSDENSFYAFIDEYHHAFNKPVLLPEAGHGDDYAPCSNYTGHYVDMMTLGFTGIAGFNSWNGFNHNTAEGNDEQMLWQSTIRAQQHMNGDDVINTLSDFSIIQTSTGPKIGSWKQGRQQEWLSSNHNIGYAKEIQYYISNNNELAVGFIKNRTYNVQTKGLNCPINLPIPNNNLQDIDWTMGSNLFVDGLKNNTDYQIDWYSFKEGWYLSSDCENTDQKKYKMKHPILLTTFYDRPIVWFVLKQQNCQKSMEIDSISSEVTNFPKTDNAIFKITPNPFITEIEVLTNSDQLIRIFSTEGNLIIEKRILAGTNFINLGNLQSGIYFIQSSLENEIFKLVKL